MSQPSPQTLEKAPPLIVFSDLDGTLLDHENYSFEPALPALESLKRLNIPLILSSSKTAAEIRDLREDMGFSHCPAIVENGGGILPPDSEDAYLADTPVHDAILAALKETPTDIRAHFAGFSDWSPEEIAARTGLSPRAAAKAAMRQFSEPGIWMGGAETLDAFAQNLMAHGVHMRRGGRFLTLSMGGSKGERVTEIIARYASADSTPQSMALGDAPNDIEMLETADIGVIIANPHGAPIPVLAGEKTSRIRRTVKPGPYGWNEEVLKVVSELAA